MKIVIFPNDRNPYQELLYEEMRKQGDTAIYLSSHLFLPIKVTFYRLQGYNVFHLHWTYAFSLRSRFFAYWYYLFCLRLIKVLGYKLVWTAHNVLPHEQVFPDDIAARRRLVAATDLVIAHSPSTIEELKKIGVEPKHFTIIPHGNYIGAYPNTTARPEARKRLNIEESDFLYLYIGQIRSYKGIEDLLNAYNLIKNNNNKLIIAGICQEPTLKKVLQDAASPNTIWYDEYIKGSELQIYFAAADVVVLPFKKVTTSGSALLALSFGKAVIVPNMGDLASLPNTIAYKYSPGENDGLIRAMKNAAQNPTELQKKSKEAKEYAKKFSWQTIAKQTHDAIHELFQSRQQSSN